MIKPIILSPGKFDLYDLDRLKQSSDVWRIVDIYESQIAELAEVRYPASTTHQQGFIARALSGELAGAWVYYPWSGVLLHCIGAEELFELRTNRNQNLITKTEQHKLKATSVAVAGMSVGSGIALACVYSGISDAIKIADFDTLETANLNRLREALTDIGIAKTELAAHHIYELNPFASVASFDKGLHASDVDDFLTGANVVVDEIDDFKMKVNLRLKAREKQIPLLMFTSLGDNILIDIERYDNDPDLAIFNGAIDDTAEEILAKKEFSDNDMKRYAVQLVGRQYVPTRALASLPEIGKSLVGRPQLYSTISIDGGLAAYVIKKIVLGEPVKSGRYFVRFAELIDLAE